jgi:hypothetical protein
MIVQGQRWREPSTPIDQGYVESGECGRERERNSSTTGVNCTTRLREAKGGESQRPGTLARVGVVALEDLNAR